MADYGNLYGEIVAINETSATISNRIYSDDNNNAHIQMTKWGEGIAGPIKKIILIGLNHSFNERIKSEENEAFSSEGIVDTIHKKEFQDGKKYPLIGLLNGNPSSHSKTWKKIGRKDIDKSPNLNEVILNDN